MCVCVCVCVCVYKDFNSFNLYSVRVCTHVCMYVRMYIYVRGFIYVSELIGWFFVQFDFGLLHGWQLQLDRVDGALWDVCLEADAVAAAAVATAAGAGVAGAGVVGVSCCCFWVNYFHFLVLFVFSRFGCLLLLLLLLLLLWLLRWLVVVVAAAVVFCCSFDLSCNDVMIGKSMLTVMHFLTF